MLTASSVSSQSDRSEGSPSSWCGRQHRDTGAHMKINLPIFKDEDAKAHKDKQLITPPNPGQLVSSSYRSSRGPSQPLKHLLCTWCTWKRRAPRKTKKWKVKTPTVLMESLRNSWCVLWELWRMLKWRRSVVIIVVVWNTSSTTAH